MSVNDFIGEDGKIKCSCGSEDFDMKTSDGTPQIAPNGPLLNLHFRCKECRKGFSLKDTYIASYKSSLDDCDFVKTEAIPLTAQGFVPKKAVPTRQDVPADILKALEVDGAALDETVHEEKAGEATGINNDGYWSQLEYLRSNGWTWIMIRKALSLEVPDETSS